MAKLKSPLMSLNAQGGLAGSIVFTRRSLQNEAIVKALPVDPRSPAQLAHRDWVDETIALWHAMSQADKSTYVPDHKLGYGRNSFRAFAALWFAGVVPVHASRHEHGGADELLLKDLNSGSVGNAGIAQQNHVALPDQVFLWGLYNQSSSGPSPIDLSATIPAGTTAIDIRVTVWDSASSGGGAYVQLFFPGKTSNMLCRPGFVNNELNNSFVVFPCPSDRIFNIQIGATGANTLNTEAVMLGYYQPSQV